MTEATGVWMGEVAAVSAALAEGKACEKQVVGSSVWKDIDPDYLAMFHRNTHYRVKPVPKYRPFTLDESGKLLTRAVRSAYDGQLFETDGIVKGPISWDVVVRVNHAQTMKVAVHEMCERFTFADTGKPCGVLVEEGQ